MAKMAKVVLLLCVVAFASAEEAQQMPGGWTAVDVKKDKIAEGLMLQTPLELDEISNSVRRHKVVHLNKVESQVVAGMNYRFDVDIGETSCQKNTDSETPIKDCPVVDGSVQNCVVTYWVQPWLKTQAKPSIQCSQMNHAETKRETPLLGGEVTLDKDAEEAKPVANYAVDQMNARSNSLQKMVLMDVERVSKQTVQGTKWSLLLRVGESSCVKNRQTEPDGDCASKVSKVSLCSVVVIEKAWLKDNNYEMQEPKCAVVSKDKNPSQHTNTVTKMSQRKPVTSLPKLGGDYHDIGNYGSYQDFKVKYNKVYDDKAEDTRRFKIFRKNMRLARKMQDKEKGTATYGASKFADLTSKEFRKMLTPDWDISVADTMDKAEIPDISATPAAWDWRDHNAVSAVKNQGSCGSCWAFSTTGNVEGQWALKKGKLTSLSEQELVDCDKVDQGCGGGLPANAYKAIEKLGGLESEKDYPYEGENDKCTFNKKDVEVYINSSVSISTNEDDMKAWLYKNGPISIGINANAMQFYMGGVSHPWSFLCSPDNLDHGVLIVGYGTSSGWFGENPYWIIKNSWGADWGEKGYYLVYRGGGVCGLNKMPTSAVVN